MVSLLEAVYRHVSVIDLSPTALPIARRRIVTAAGTGTWLMGDVLSLPVSDEAFDVWHDRAVFHFLTHRSKAPGMRVPVEPVAA